MNDEMNQTPAAPVADDNSGQDQAQAAPQTDAPQTEAPAAPEEGTDNANQGSGA